MLNWILKFIPAEYKWSVAIKKASYTVGKLAAAGLMMGVAGRNVGSKLSPEQIQQVQGTVGAITAAGLEGLHDWLKLKYPNATWL